MKTVLIVENNPNDRKLLRLILERRGVTVLEASHGEQALEVLAGQTPDLIVSDALMPVMDGFLLLNAIALTVQEMQMDCKSGELDRARIDEDAERIMQTLSYLSTTIHDFQRALHTVPHREKFSVREVVERTLSLIAPLNSGIETALTVESDAQVNADPYYYSQVLMNVLANARDSLAKVTDRPRRIDIELASEDGKSLLIMRDNGGGISEKVLPQVFEPYFTTKFQGRGTGISLYMSKMIIEKQMGGSITLRNTGEGVEVRIEV